MSVATLLPLSLLDLSPPQVPRWYLWGGEMRLPLWTSYERHQDRHQDLYIIPTDFGNFTAWGARDSWSVGSEPAPESGLGTRYHQALRHKRPWCVGIHR